MIQKNLRKKNINLLKKDNKNKYEKLNIFEYFKNSMRTEDKFTEAFKILEMEPTTDKEKIKKKY